MLFVWIRDTLEFAEMSWKTRQLFCFISVPDTCHQAIAWTQYEKMVCESGATLKLTLKTTKWGYVKDSTQLWGTAFRMTRWEEVVLLCRLSHTLIHGFLMKCRETPPPTTFLSTYFCPVCGTVGLVGPVVFLQASTKFWGLIKSSSQDYLNLSHDVTVPYIASKCKCL